MSSQQKDHIVEEMKTSMRNKNRQRTGTLRLILSAIKQVEVDERIVINDVRVTDILAKMVKQRHESIKQYVNGNRQDLADQEATENEIIQEFLPQPLSEGEITQLIEQAIVDTNASSMKNMGQVMTILKPKILGKADASLVSSQVKKLLG